MEILTFTDRQRSLSLFWPTVAALALVCMVLGSMLYAGLSHIRQPQLAQTQTTQVR
jgi:hypothetical protein